MNTTFASIQLAVLVLPVLSIAQPSPTSDTTKPFRAGIEMAGGYAYRLRSTNTLPGNYVRGGATARLRLKWGSHNVVGAGIETGWLPVSSLSATNSSTTLGTTDIEASLNAVPVLFVVALQRFNTQLHIGLGFYDVRVSSTVFGSTIRSSEWDFGYMLSLGYAYALSPAVKLGAEVKWDNISEAQISMLSACVRVMVPLWEW